MHGLIVSDRSIKLLNRGAVQLQCTELFELHTYMATATGSSIGAEG